MSAGGAADNTGVTDEQSVRTCVQALGLGLHSLKIAGSWGPYLWTTPKCSLGSMFKKQIC